LRRYYTVADENGENRALALLSDARTAVEKAKTVQEIKSIRDKAEAVRQYAKQAEEGLEIQNHCAEIKLRAERKGGDLLGEMRVKGLRRTKGGRNNGSHDVTDSKPSKYGNLVAPPPTLKDLGLEKMEAHRWQAEASVPEEKFERLVKECADTKQELTQNALLVVARKTKRKGKPKTDGGGESKELRAAKRAFAKLTKGERVTFLDWIKDPT
jgi:hypothetical protein